MHASDSTLAKDLAGEHARPIEIRNRIDFRSIRKEGFGVSALLNSIRSRTRTLFQNRFATPAQWCVAAPGRVNLIGEHTDYNEGYVLPFAIDRYLCIAARSIPENIIRCYSTALCEDIEIPFDRLDDPRGPHWATYLRGVLAEFRQVVPQLTGVELLIESTIPVGGGLSSSAALQIAFASLLERVSGHTLSPIVKAELCLRAEQRYAGVPCGIMDQAISVFGRNDRFLFLDCRSHTMEWIPFLDPKLTLLIINTGTPHALANGEYARRREDCRSAACILQLQSLRNAAISQVDAAESKLGEVLHRRARHVITENQRVLECVRALKCEEWRNVGQLLFESHASLRNDFEVTSPELDFLVDQSAALSKNGGILGTRMTGGGFGGCTVSLVETESVTPMSDALADSFEKAFGRRPEIFCSRPVAGTHFMLAAPAESGS